MSKLNTRNILGFVDGNTLAIHYPFLGMTVGYFGTATKSFSKAWKPLTPDQRRELRARPHGDVVRQIDALIASSN